jgi:hypothetical protein
VLVYPGGGREVAKRKGEKYQLLWKERVGFARLAIEAAAAAPRALLLRLRRADRHPAVGRAGRGGVRALRDEVRQGVQERIAFLLAERDVDPDRDLLTRTRRGLSGLRQAEPG